MKIRRKDHATTSLEVMGDTLLQQEHMAKWVRLLFPLPHEVMGKKGIKLIMKATLVYEEEVHKMPEDGGKG